MERGSDGYHRTLDPLGEPGDTYKYRLDGGETFPDPASHAQSADVHGPSVVVDPRAFAWSDGDWKRPPFRDLVIYEAHVGTFTPEGTFRAMIEKLPHLRALGINALELMPIADFPGARNWGYDGVSIYAPARAYGSPDDLRALVDAAHAQGIAVILDVVYNHFGPDGNYLGAFSRSYFNEEHHTPWGAGFNFDGENAQAVRDFFLQNPVYWMEHFHIDGFRFDATHAIVDTSERAIFSDLVQVIHERGGYAIAEDSRNEAVMIEAQEKEGHGFDAVWSDDFHHVVRVSQTAEKGAYFQYFEGSLDELIETLQHGWLHHGQKEMPKECPTGTPCQHLPPARFLFCISNHDQAGNRAFGERINTSVSAEAYRAMSMLLCLVPYTPMLFMGQEWAARTPFLYFTDHREELGALITEGRRREFAGFAEFKNETALEKIPDPQDEETFLRSKLAWDEPQAAPHSQVLALYTASLQLRRQIAIFRPHGREGWRVGALHCGVGAIRFEDAQSKYLLIFDLSGGHRGVLRTESLATLQLSERWEVVLSSNESRFGGTTESSFDPETQCFVFPTPETLLLRAAC